VATKLKDRTLEEIKDRFGNRILLVVEQAIDGYNFEHRVYEAVDKELRNRLDKELGDVIRQRAKEAVSKLTEEDLANLVKQRLLGKL
jgi:hypothetical protein